MNYFYIGDGVLYHPSGKIKVVTDAAFLRALTPQSLLQNGAVVLPYEMYRETDALEFTLDQVQKDRFGTVWLALARDDKALLAEYRKAVSAELKVRYNYKGENMRVSLAPAQKVITGQSWCVFYCDNNASTYGGSLGGNYPHRFLGVAPVAQGVNLERKV